MQSIGHLQLLTYGHSTSDNLFYEFVQIRKVMQDQAPPKVRSTLVCEPFLFFCCAICTAVCPAEFFCAGLAPSSRRAATIFASPILAAVWIGYFVFSIVFFGAATLL